ncbi:uncharacterized protein TOT_030000905 [Theileria orientalis strain Shintoku]|uniref:Vps52 coiled-coil domain-containing protein n=1 Tax=Theileria orientalis strain Shintoku TaxID=869250 RepID=J4C3S0_THEOR|nr:uncharacterized protein TOT_030000905 [Theileria orientalis strain Shintoku]BAM40926.1 uncharacterized protein TOT_030000905 [Theileria orientalis strain Shintoku]|eukprot:XP_009691227.1 uncharacterized protein TOT_030000905 [Theileria orientalis strain Shintoku]
MDFFNEGLDSLCDDLKGYLDSLTVSNTIRNLHPSFNRNLSSLFANSENTTTLSHTDLSNHRSKSDDSNGNLPVSHLEETLNDQSLSNLHGKHVTSETISNVNTLNGSSTINDHASFYNKLSLLCNNKRYKLENEVISTLLKHEKELSEFSIDLNHSNSTLELIERALSNQYKMLEVSCTNIKKLHDESKDISHGLENRKKLVEKLQEFVKDVIITPAMIRSLCGDAINEEYVGLVEEFEKKVERIKTKYRDKEYPAVEFTKIQIKKLELVLIRRIFDFLSMEISNLAVPKVNIQLMQMTRFSSYRPLYKYLTNFPDYTNDLKKLYVYTMKKTYSHLFENYLNSLESCFEKERCRDTSYILKVRTPEVVKRLNKTISYYDLDGRDKILDDFNSQPMLPTGLKPGSIKKELIVKSYFKLLVDTCATELGFLRSFFGTSFTTTNTTGPSTTTANVNRPERAMLKEMFSEVFEVISFNMKTYFRGSFDFVALGLIYSVLRFNRRTLLHKKITFFESEMYELETLAYERSSYILKEVHGLIVKATRNPQITTIFTWTPAPFVVNASHILMVILRINEYTNRFNSHLVQLLEALRDMIDRCSKRLDPNKNAVFVINNTAPLVEVLDRVSNTADYTTETFNLEAYSAWMKLELDSNLAFYSNYLLTEFVSDLINLMSRKEDEDEEVDVTPKKTLTLATEALEYRTICMEFIENYNERIVLIKNLVMQAFPYGPTTTLVNKNVFDSFHKIYEKFYKVIMEMFKESPSDWLAKMPNPSEFKN